MNWNIVSGKWTQLKGELRTRWGKLTDDDLAHAAGQRDRLVGKIVERYGVVKAEAERQVDEWVTKMSDRLDQVGRSDKPQQPHR